MKTSKNERWSASFIRIGNKAVREAQARNRELGIVNWYSVNGQLVNDAAAPEPNPDKKLPVTSPL
ncbi:hypothetical protein [Methylovulum psychrotolerans]|uniref:Uncharacterized protein n=1 Tax=Methylovulum psychrotolerans TaxID=1704499 RepID=A0A1Z4BY31_9GAMM|nr:hypothetical protein [Methylovulum psychrotolerans]ASF46207.1 hypothetical protein CEK71_08995 [Methylovulum psychrotolerans]